MYRTRRSKNTPNNRALSGGAYWPSIFCHNCHQNFEFSNFLLHRKAVSAKDNENVTESIHLLLENVLEYIRKTAEEENPSIKFGGNQAPSPQTVSKDGSSCCV